MGVPDPYLKVPKLGYLAKWTLLALPFLIVGSMLGVGVAVQFPPFNSPIEQPKGVTFDAELPVWEQSAWPPAAARMHYARIFSFVTNFPRVCWPGREVNEFQREQCAIFRDRLMWGGGLCLMPVLVLLLLMGGAGDRIQKFYRRAGKMVRENPNGQLMATVTNPARASGDFFSWLYGFQTVSVQLPNNEQRVVYIPPDAPIPLPGQKFRLYNMGHHLRAERWTGALHAPHLAIVSGSR